MLFADWGRVRADPYPADVPPVAEMVRREAPMDWRSRERARQALAQELHRAATEDLVGAQSLWALVPTDGPVDDLLSARHSSEVPSIHLSRAAARLAVWSCVAEMRVRRGALGWVSDSLAVLIASHRAELPDLAAEWQIALADQLPRLQAAAGALTALSDDELARLVGRTYEFALTTSWLFRDPAASPERLWHVWRAKQAGCFFTPEFVARHLASVVISEDTMSVLDPAVGGGAFLIEAYLRMVDLGIEEPADRLFGVDLDGVLRDLSALVVAFLSKAPLVGRLQRSANFIRGDSLLTSHDGRTAGVTWADWFPTVVTSGGFDALLMNPPYVQLKVNHSSLPARPGDSDEATAHRMAGIELARGAAQALSQRLRAHPDFRYAHGGVPDLPRFFIERALSLLRPGGRLACIVPSTFLADHRSKGVRRHLLSDHTVRELDLVPEDARLFADVNQPTCLLVVDKGRASEVPIRFRTGVDSPFALQAKQSTSLSRRLLVAVDPEHLRVPACEPEDWDILALLHEHPRIGDHDWIENLRGELDLTLDQRFISEVPTPVPLVRGDQIERFTSDLASDKPRWTVPDFLHQRISARKLEHVERLRVVGRQCSYLKKPRRLSFSLVEPGAVVANSCNYLVVRDEPARELSRFLLGALNSSALEWRFRLTSSTNHVGNYELDALPVPVAEAGLVETVNELVNHLLHNPHDTTVDAELDGVWFDAYGLSASDSERVRSALSA